MSNVSIVRASYEGNLYGKVGECIELCGGVDLDDGDNVVIKINLCDFRPPETGAITHPKFLAALLKYLRTNFRGLKIKVVESDATSTNADLLAKWFGFTTLISKFNAKWVNLSRTRRVKREINGRFFKSMEIPEIFNENPYFITLAKLKTHSITKISCALKNQFGCIPIKRKVQFHPHIDDVIVDANLAMKPNFSIIDGIIGLGGAQGPIWGPPIHSKTIIASPDPVAADTVCAKILGFHPNFIGHIKKAETAGLGSMKHKIIGESLGNVKTNPHFNTPEWMITRIANHISNLKRTW